TMIEKDGGGNRYKYTWGCGWFDDDHLGGARMAMAMMSNFFSDHKKFRTPGFTFTIRNTAFGKIIKGYGFRDKSLTMYKMKKMPPPYSYSNYIWRWMAAYISYRTAVAAEVRQWEISGSKWSFEDLPTDWMGVMLFLK